MENGDLVYHIDHRREDRNSSFYRGIGIIVSQDDLSDTFGTDLKFYNVLWTAQGRVASAVGRYLKPWPCPKDKV